MGIRSKGSKETNTPTHNLVVILTTKAGKQVKLGNVGLFTENNSYHEVISEMSEAELAELNLSFEIAKYGESTKAEITKADLI